MTLIAGCSSGLGGGNTGGSGGGGTTGGVTNPLAQDLIDAFVLAHNQARSGPLTPPPSPALPPVSWDGVLADAVYSYAIRCQGSNGLLSHNANRSADYQALGGSGYVGENIYGSSGNADARGRDDVMDERSVELRLQQRHFRRRGPLHADRLAGERANRLRDRRLPGAHAPQYRDL